MFKKNSYGEPSSFDSLLGVNSFFEGNFRSEGTVRIEGKLKGDVTVSGNLHIGSQALVTGNVRANNITLAGTIEGNVHADGMFKLLSSAKLQGDITVQSFVADEGGEFNGKCSMISPPVQQNSGKNS